MSVKAAMKCVMTYVSILLVRTAVNAMTAAHWVTIEGAVQVGATRRSTTN